MWEEQAKPFLETLSGITRQRYRAALEEFGEWYRASFGDEPDAALLTPQELREWVGYLQSVRNLKAASINLRLSALRSFARFHGRELRLRGPRQERPPVEALDGRELERLLAALEGETWLDRRNRALVAVLARAGLRVSEALSLRVADVNLNARSGWLLVRKGKGMKERRVPLSAEARRALRDYLDVRPSWAGELLFVTRTGRQMSARDVQRLLQDAARRAGIPKRVTPHVLRHTFATRFLQAGGDIATLAEILGHERIATTTRYLHPDAARMQEMSEAKQRSEAIGEPEGLPSGERAATPGA